VILSSIYVYVCPFICPIDQWQQQQCGRFTAGWPAGRRHRSIAGAGAQQHDTRQQMMCISLCHIDSQVTRLNTDLLITVTVFRQPMLHPFDQRLNIVFVSFSFLACHYKMFTWMLLLLSRFVSIVVFKGCDVLVFCTDWWCCSNDKLTHELPDLCRVKCFSWDGCLNFLMHIEISCLLRYLSLLIVWLIHLRT